MASIEVPVSNEKLLALLEEKQGLSVGNGRVDPDNIVVTMQPPTSNSIVSHHVDVTIRFGLELGEVESLIGF